MKILMVCLGNICRSPIAEGVLRQKALESGLDWVIDSAGTNGYHVGEAPHPSSQKVCREHGIDISMQRARRFSPKDFDRYDIIYAFAGDVYEDIGHIAGKHGSMDKVKFFLSELEAGSRAAVPDPWYGDDSGYLPVFRMIEETCRAIIEKYA